MCHRKILLINQRINQQIKVSSIKDYNTENIKAIIKVSKEKSVEKLLNQSQFCVYENFLFRLRGNNFNKLFIGR